MLLVILITTIKSNRRSKTNLESLIVVRGGKDNHITLEALQELIKLADPNCGLIESKYLSFRYMLNTLSGPIPQVVESIKLALSDLNGKAILRGIMIHNIVDYNQRYAKYVNRIDKFLTLMFGGNHVYMDYCAKKDKQTVAPEVVIKKAMQMTSAGAAGRAVNAMMAYYDISRYLQSHVKKYLHKILYFGFSESEIQNLCDSVAWDMAYEVLIAKFSFYSAFIPVRNPLIFYRIAENVLPPIIVHGSAVLIVFQVYKLLRKIKKQYIDGKKSKLHNQKTKSFIKLLTILLYASLRTV